MVNDVYRNQTGIINIDEFQHLKITIIGLGSIGSFLALGLNKMGFKDFILIDSDMVERHNVTTQLYSQKEVGTKKATAILKYLACYATPYSNRFGSKDTVDTDVVFICVDSLQSRREIVYALLDSIGKTKTPKLIIDGRMHGLVFRVFTIPTNKNKHLRNYVKGLVEPEYTGSCTEKGIIQNVYAVTAVMIEQFKKVLLNQPYDKVINCDWEQYKFIGR